MTYMEKTLYIVKQARISSFFLTYVDICMPKYKSCHKIMWWPMDFDSKQNLVKGNVSIA